MNTETVTLKHSNSFAKTNNMRILYTVLMAMAMSACHSYKVDSSRYNSLIGTWEQPNVTLTFKDNSKYHYEYVDAGYKYEQSGKYRYFSDRDSLVLYNYYPDAYTKESKNEYWSLRKLTPDSLIVYVHKNIVVLECDTLNTSGNEIEIYTRKNSIN